MEKSTIQKKNYTLYQIWTNPQTITENSSERIQQIITRTTQLYSRVWKGILGILGYEENTMNYWENDAYLDGNRYFTDPWEAGRAKFGHGIQDVFRLWGIWEIITTQINILAAKATGVSFKPNYRVCLVNSYLIETVREYFVSTRCQKSPCGVIAYQLLTPCSIDSVAQSLQRFIFILILRGVFQQLIR